MRPRPNTILPLDACCAKLDYFATLDKPAERYEDPDTDNMIEVVPADYLHGLNKLLDALEGK